MIELVAGADVGLEKGNSRRGGKEASKFLTEGEEREVEFAILSELLTSAPFVLLAIVTAPVSGAPADDR